MNVSYVTNQSQNAGTSSLRNVDQDIYASYARNRAFSLRSVLALFLVAALSLIGGTGHSYAASPATATTKATSTGTVIPSTFFGMETLNVNGNNPMPRGTIRSQDVNYPQINWATINTARGVYNWSTLDTWVQMATARGEQVIFLLGGTPTWASQCPGSTTGLNNNGSNCPPTSAGIWTDWVTAVSTRYKGRIKYYELWNEPNDARNWPIASSTAWQTLSNLGQLAQASVHAADSSALLTTPSFTGEQNSGELDSVLSYGPQYFDAVTFHTYGSYTDYASAEAKMTDIQNYAAVAAKYGLSKLPFLSTEGSWGTGGPYITDTAAQADFLVKYMVLHATSGVAVAVWYAADAGPEWGQLEGSNGINAAGVAYQAVYNALAGSTVQKLDIMPNGTYSVQFRKSNGQYAMIAWNSERTSGLMVNALNNASTAAGVSVAIVNHIVNVGTTPVFIW